MSDVHNPEPGSGASGGSGPTCAELLASQLGLESLRAIFPNWRLGGTSGYLFVVRGGIETASGPRSLLRCCLSTGTIQVLADNLCLHNYLDGLSDEELADVWQQVELPHPTEQAAS